MKTSIPSLFAAAFLSVAVPVFAADKPADKKEEAQPVEKCEHGVKKSLCSRCNPKLKPVFKAKGDWCGEHDRPESQCAICNPNLAKQGIKP